MGMSPFLWLERLRFLFVLLFPGLCFAEHSFRLRHFRVRGGHPLICFSLDFFNVLKNDG